MTHAELVEACRKIALDEGCLEPILDPRRRWGRGEHPDAFAVYERSQECAYQVDTGPSINIRPGMTLVLECKTSLSDLRKDREKPWRSDMYALGDIRCYVAEEGVIEAHDIEDRWGWGLISIRPNGTHQMLVQPRLFRPAFRNTISLLALAYHNTFTVRQTQEISHNRKQRNLTSQEETDRQSVLECLQTDGTALMRDLISVCDVRIKPRQVGKCIEYLRKLGFEPIKGSRPTRYTYTTNCEGINE